MRTYGTRRDRPDPTRQTGLKDRRSAAVNNDRAFDNQTLDACVAPGKTPVHRSALSNTYRQYALECDNAKGRHRSHP
ncbi:hypothetical protein GCM10019016_139260 [Streptomyces prasinosporus]|uniref:Uncharacterized protein n=1 Tax=Streptomyces prasinosporus TaxID=68256 RepID=A0ABP6UGC6_9ACTN